MGERGYGCTSQGTRRVGGRPVAVLEQTWRQPAFSVRLHGLRPVWMTDPKRLGDPVPRA